MTAQASNSDNAVNPRRFLSAAPWDFSVFTTFSLSLSFYEVVVLDELMRGCGNEVRPVSHILSDVKGVRSAFSELGATRAGLDYSLHPARLNGGFFHPKVSVLSSKDDTHLLVGSGNLTFGGWGQNLEVVEHLHPSFAAKAFLDSADFFDDLCNNKRLDFESSFRKVCQEAAERLRAAARNRKNNGDIRVIYNSINEDGKKIGDKIAEFSDEIGGAEKITVVSPFFDYKGAGLNKLRSQTRCENISFYAHPHKTVMRQSAISWPSKCSFPIDTVEIELLKEDTRPLHAKIFEIQCRRGRIIVSGSANATDAGLWGANAEACVVRIQRGTAAGWVTEPADAPESQDISAASEDENSADPETHILTASLAAGKITGCILGSMTAGAAQAALKQPDRIDLGSVNVDEGGHFSVSARVIDKPHGSVVLEIKKDDMTAEGFVTMTGWMNVARKWSPRIAAAMGALFRQEESPADAVKIFAFILDQWDQPYNQEKAFSGGGKRKTAADTDSEPARLVDASALESVSRHRTDTGTGNQGGQNQRFQDHYLQLMIKALSDNLHPIEYSDADDDDADSVAHSSRAAVKRRARYEKDLDSAYWGFDELLEAMTSCDQKADYANAALHLCQYMATRLQAPKGDIVKWLYMSLQAAETLDIEDDLGWVTCLIYYASQQETPDSVSRARAYLSTRVADLQSLQVPPDKPLPFPDLLPPDCDLQQYLDKVRAARTYGEEIRSFIAVLRGQKSSGSYTLLKKTKYWKDLERALSRKSLDNITIMPKTQDSCPKCNINLISYEKNSLEQTGVGKAASCCGQILINEDAA